MKNLMNITALAAVLLALVTISSCKKENILWIQPGHEYHIDALLVKDAQGQWFDAGEEFFGYADDMTFTKYHPYGVRGEGVVKVIDHQYAETQYSGYTYDYYCGCYYDTWETYTVTTQNTEINEYYFDWDKESQRRISLNFKEAGQILQGHNPNSKSFWDFLDQDYVVSFQGREQGRVRAELIMLETESVKMVLRR